MKCILRILIMQFPQHIKHRHVCRYGGATLEKGFICARSNFVDEAPIIRSSAWGLQKHKWNVMLVSSQYLDQK
jgi:hypothetical protein